MKGEYCGLQTDYKTLKTSFNQLRLQHTEVKGRLNEAQEQLALMDVEHSKAVNRCEVLSQMNSSLEDDRKSLMSQVETSHRIYELAHLTTIFLGLYFVDPVSRAIDPDFE